MLEINGKKFMNLPEAVQWLLNNNALPFQSTANYVADTVIAKTTIVNPSPVEIKVGSLVLFADSKVGTVSGVTDSGFMVGQQYTDIAASLVMIQNLSLDASGHMIVTLTDETTVDAGLVKQLSGMSINASQHLIATYNDGTSTDLGAIFQGDLAIFENITDSSGNKRFIGGAINTNPITGITYTYARWSLSGSHLMLVIAGTAEANAVINDSTDLGLAPMPQWILDKIFPFTANAVDMKDLINRTSFYTQENLGLITMFKSAGRLQIRNVSGAHTFTNAGNFRVQFDLLIDNE